MYEDREMTSGGDVKLPRQKQTKDFKTQELREEILLFNDNAKAIYESEKVSNGNKESLGQFKKRKLWDLYGINYDTWRGTKKRWTDKRTEIIDGIRNGRGSCKNHKKLAQTQGVIVTDPYFDGDDCLSALDLDNLTNTLAKNIDTIKKSPHTEKINGALQIKIDLLDSKTCPYTKVAARLKKKTNVVLPTSTALSTHITECINNAPSNEDSDFYLTSLSLLVSKGEPQPTHTDVKNIGSNNEQLQGTFMLSGESEGTIVYDMNDVPMCPSVADIVSVFDQMYPREVSGEVNDLEVALLNNEDMEAHAANWGRIMYVSDNRRPKKKIMKKYSMTIMQGNHPHNGPGSNTFRAVLFFTALPCGSNKDQAYGDTQMSKEGFIITIIRKILPSLKKNNDILTIKRLYHSFASAVADSAQYGARDQTLTNNSTKDDFGAVKFSHLINNLITCVEKCNTDPSTRNAVMVSTAKDMIALFIPTKLCEKRI